MLHWETSSTIQIVSYMGPKGAAKRTNHGRCVVVGGDKKGLDSTTIQNCCHQPNYTRLERRNDDERKYDLLFESFAAVHPFSTLAVFVDIVNHCQCSPTRKPATPQECIIKTLLNNRARCQGRERDRHCTSIEAYVSRTLAC